MLHLNKQLRFSNKQEAAGCCQAGMRPSEVSSLDTGKDNCQTVLSTARDNSSDSETNCFYVPGFSQILLSFRQYYLFFRNNKVKKLEVNLSLHFSYQDNLKHQLVLSKSPHTFFSQVQSDIGLLHLVKTGHYCC